MVFGRVHPKQYGLLRRVPVGLCKSYPYLCRQYPPIVYPYLVATCEECRDIEGERKRGSWGGGEGDKVRVMVIVEGCEI
eukprot:764379-Hanusia_phi.AAC.6